jgi:hypothetical protein
VDYKDVASATSDSLLTQALDVMQRSGIGYAKKRAISLALKRMPDGAACPRAFEAWDKSGLVAAIKAATVG